MPDPYVTVWAPRPIISTEAGGPLLLSTISVDIGQLPLTTKGDLLGVNSTPALVRKGIGTEGYYLRSTSSDAAGFAWKPIIQPSPSPSPTAVVGFDNITGEPKWLEAGVVSVTVIDSTDSPYAVLDTDGVVIGDLSAGPISVTLPLATASEGRRFSFRAIRSVTPTDALSIFPGGGDQIEGGDVSQLNLYMLDGTETHGQACTLISDGIGNWTVIDWKTELHGGTHIAGAADPIQIDYSQISSGAPDLTLKADLASPTFTGDPKAPTPATADNDTSIATTAHVQANVALEAAARATAITTHEADTTSVHGIANTASITPTNIATGTTGSTVCIGNDSRLSDTRTPTDATVTLAKMASGLGVVSGLTAGRITFAGSATTLDDDPGFIWDDVNKWVGLGISTPEGIIDMLGGPYLRQASNTVGAPLVRIYKGRGTDVGANLKRAKSGDTLGGMNILPAVKADDTAGAAWAAGARCSFAFVASEDQQAASCGASFNIKLCPIGSATIATVLTIADTGDITPKDGANLVLSTGTGMKIGTSTTQKLGFFNSTPIVKPTVSGAKGGNAALGSLMTALANLGLVIDSTTA